MPEPAAKTRLSPKKKTSGSKVDLPVVVSPGNSDTSSLDDVLANFQRLRSTLASLFAAIGVDPEKTRDSARQLDLNRGLAWRLTRLVRASDPATVVSEVPARPSMRKFFSTCDAQGASPEAIQRASDAFEEFQRSADACSTDRKTLAMLIANRGSGSPGGAAIEQERARRNLFEGAGAVWGVQAKVRFVSVMVFPSPDDPDMLDAGHVTGFVDFRRLSPRPWPLSYEAVHDGSGEPMAFIKEPLVDEEGDEAHLQLLRDYCAPSAPEIQVVESGGFKRFELASGPVGNEGLTTCVFGSRLRRLYERYPKEPETAGFMVLMQTPVERVVFDLFVHKDLGVSELPRVELLDRLTFPHGNVESEFHRQLLPLTDTVRPLPEGVEGAFCTAMPWYTRLLGDVSGRLDQDLRDFDGSRFEMAYPPISTTLSRRFDQSPKP